MLSIILLSRLTPYEDEIIGDHQCGFRRNGSKNDQIFYIRLILEKKWEYNITYISCSLISRKPRIELEGKYYVIFSLSLEYPGKFFDLLRCVWKKRTAQSAYGQIFDKFPIQNGRKRDALSPMFSNFALEYAIRRVQENKEGLKLSGTHQLLDYADDIFIVGKTDAIKENTEALLDANKDVGLEVNQEKAKYMLVSRSQKVGQKHSIKIADRSFEHVAKFKYLGTTLTAQKWMHEVI
jgi:hypothetical protein